MPYKTTDQWMDSWADFRKANLAIQKAKENKKSEKTQNNATETETDTKEKVQP